MVTSTADAKLMGPHLENLRTVMREVPSNIIIKRVDPSTWLPTVMGLWSVVTIGQGGIYKRRASIDVPVNLVGLFNLV